MNGGIDGTWYLTPGGYSLSQQGLYLHMDANATLTVKAGTPYVLQTGESFTVSIHRFREGEGAWGLVTTASMTVGQKSVSTTFAAETGWEYSCRIVYTGSTLQNVFGSFHA